MFKGAEKQKKTDGNQNKRELEKSNVLFAGVIFFMLLIIIVWIFNLGNIFKQQTPDKPSTFDFGGFSQELKRSFNDIKIKVKELKNIKADELEKAKQNNNILEMAGTSSKDVIK